MPSHETAIALIQNYGLLMLLLFSVLEGPIVTVIAAYLAHQGFMNIWAVYAVCIAGDLIGDSLFYAVGRYGARRLPPRVSRWLGLTEARSLALNEHFSAKGGRTLLFGKWTHSAGMPILVASGLARMDFLRYLWFNLLGTLPKTALFVAVGYFLGAAYSSIDTYIYRASLVLLVLAVVIALVYLRWQRKRV